MSAHLDVGALEEPARVAFRRHILRLADSKRVLGIRYSDWNLGAPTVETGIAMSSMTQDEWGHARLLYAMLKELGDDPAVVEHERSADAYANLPSLDTPFPDWAATVAGIVIVDGALLVALRSFADGSFEPARSRCPKMIAEEEFHTSLGAAWYRRLAAAGGEAADLLRSATERFLSDVLAWLGTEDAPARELVASGAVRGAAEQVAELRAILRDTLAVAGVDVDAASPAELPWDEARGRGPGRPDDDTVERARGDRNRALLVE